MPDEVTRPAEAGVSRAAFHVFSIRPKDGHGDEARQYVTRKSHRKSRAGCATCKRRRVKCDELRPRCGRCLKAKVECQYVDHSSDASSSGSINSGTSAGNPVAPVTAVQRPLEKASPYLKLLKHYDGVVTGGQGGPDTVTCSDILVGPQASSVYRANVLQLAQGQSSLLHSILAVAAMHLEHCGVQGHHVQMLSHTQLALADFQSTISKPIIGKANNEAVLLTSMMINMLYFSYVDSADPRDCWVFSSKPNRLEWLSLAIGRMAILNRTKAYLVDSFIRVIWGASAYVPNERFGLPPGMLEYFGVHDGMSEQERQSNPYLAALARLAPLMTMERGSITLIRYFGLVSTLGPEFLILVQRNDTRALLILAYWYGLMANVQFWWTTARVLRDCQGLVMYLEAHGDEKLRRLLQFPADACGYTLQSNDEYDFDDALELGQWEGQHNDHQQPSTGNFRIE